MIKTGRMLSAIALTRALFFKLSFCHHPIFTSIASVSKDLFSTWAGEITSEASEISGDLIALDSVFCTTGNIG